MNKRQAKKNFKKKYGCNPEEFADVFCTNLGHALDELRPAMENAMKGICDAITHLCEYMQSEEIIKKMKEACANVMEQTKEIQEHEN